ncbi:MAG: hypothetical protein ACRCX2_34790 [Paraclostridium sp.]
MRSKLIYPSSQYSISAIVDDYLAGAGLRKKILEKHGAYEWGYSWFRTAFTFETVDDVFYTVMIWTRPFRTEWRVELRVAGNYLQPLFDAMWDLSSEKYREAVIQLVKLIADPDGEVFGAGTLAPAPSKMPFDFGAVRAWNLREDYNGVDVPPINLTTTLQHIIGRTLSYNGLYTLFSDIFNAFRGLQIRNYHHIDSIYDIVMISGLKVFTDTKIARPIEIKRVPRALIATLKDAKIQEIVRFLLFCAVRAKIRMGDCDLEGDE